MTSHNQLQAVLQEVTKVGAQIDKAKGELAKAKAETDNKEVDFLRNTLVELRKEKVELHRKENTLLEQETILLRAQASGQHCLPLSKLTKNACPYLYASCEGSFPTLCCPLAMRKHQIAGGERPHSESTGQSFRQPKRPLTTCAAPSLLLSSHPLVQLRI